jgi:Flp pilus assembly protein TadB
MLSWQVSRVKITRIVEMDLPVPVKYIARATIAELQYGSHPPSATRRATSAYSFR